MELKFIARLLFQVDIQPVTTPPILFVNWETPDVKILLASFTLHSNFPLPGDIERRHHHLARLLRADVEESSLYSIGKAKEKQRNKKGTAEERDRKSKGTATERRGQAEEQQRRSK